jgi:phospholipid/cholesterol/gamma-HCH transport system ATP-binding protein
MTSPAGPTDHPPDAIPLEIRVENLHKAFGTNLVLQGINLSIRPGELIAVVGGSGSGKSVLLRHIIGQLVPDQGSVSVADHESPGAPLVDLSTLDDDGMDRLRIHWAVVFQRNALLSGTVEENIALPLELVKGLTAAKAQERILWAVKAVGLKPDEVLNVSRDELSGGMAKRVAIARAVAMEPMLIFYDEPTTGLDPESAKMIQDLVFEMHRKQGDGPSRTSLVITHDKDLLYRLQPRVVMLYEGKVFFDGPYRDFEKSTSPVIRPYFELMPVLHQRSTPTHGPSEGR